MALTAEEKLAAAREKFAGVTKIVTHGHNAHTDEVMAMAIVLALLENQVKSVERREVTDADLADPSVLVLDEGRRFKAESNNVDHHHTEKLPCTLNLILERAGLHDDFLKWQPWYKNTSLEDLEGTNAVAKKYGLTKRELREVRPPAGVDAVHYLVGHHQGVLPLMSIEFLKSMGHKYLSESVNTEPALEKLNELSLPVHTTGKGVRYIVYPKGSYAAAVEVHAQQNHIHAAITINGKPKKVVIRRIDDDAVNLCAGADAMLKKRGVNVASWDDLDDQARYETREKALLEKLGVAFVHNSGFMLEFDSKYKEPSQLPIDEILDASKVEKKRKAEVPGHFRRPSVSAACFRR